MAREKSEENESEDGIAAEYGDEDGDENPYEFEKEGNSEEQDDDLHIDNKDGKGGIFDKEEDDSEVEEFMENLENEEMELDGLKLPSDAEEDDLDGDEDDDEPGLDDYDDEEGFSDNLRDDYGGENASEEDAPSADGEGEEDNEDELDDVFNRANEN